MLPSSSSFRARPAVAGLVALIAAVLLVAACTDDSSDDAGNPDLFCESAREAFTGNTEFDFRDPAQRQQVLDVLDRMVEYAPGEIRSDVEATRDAVSDYAEALAERDERLDEIDSGDAESLSEDDIEEIQELVTEIEENDDLEQARSAIEPYLEDTCAIDLGSGTETTVAPAGTDTSAP